jgi:hypothetical protein
VVQRLAISCAIFCEKINAIRDQKVDYSVFRQSPSSAGETNKANITKILNFITKHLFHLHVAHRSLQVVPYFFLPILHPKKNLLIIGPSVLQVCNKECKI